ncbi:hypothetical protein [Ruania rhizosphaerae]|uniref:hypothetical protein n=1 Tax=Ruania rhizosphaerae TaxID=1840413 RepID=UPI001357287F|nr:hypothetical protein [Ruania rhizosphaerae]
MPAARDLPRTRRLRSVRVLVLMAAIGAVIVGLAVIRALLDDWRSNWVAAVIVAAVAFAIMAVAFRGARALGERARVVEQEERAALGESQDPLPYGIAERDGLYVVRGRRAVAVVLGGMGGFFALIGVFVWSAVEEDRWVALGTIAGCGVVLAAMGLLVGSARVVLDPEGIERRYGTIRRASWAEVPTIVTSDARRVELRGNDRKIVIPTMGLDVDRSDLIRTIRRVRGF